MIPELHRPSSLVQAGFVVEGVAIGLCG
jgi:hypothetical protein